MSGNRLLIGGPSGALKWGYHDAASLGRWSVTSTVEGLQLSAHVVRVDAFKVSQRPLSFVVDRPAGAWIWPVASLQITGETLTATLVP